MKRRSFIGKLAAGTAATAIVGPQVVDYADYYPRNLKYDAGSFLIASDVTAKKVLGAEEFKKWKKYNRIHPSLSSAFNCIIPGRGGYTFYLPPGETIIISSSLETESTRPPHSSVT